MQKTRIVLLTVMLLAITVTALAQSASASWYVQTNSKFFNGKVALGQTSFTFWDSGQLITSVYTWMVIQPDNAQNAWLITGYDYWGWGAEEIAKLTIWNDNWFATSWSWQQWYQSGDFSWNPMAPTFSTNGPVLLNNFGGIHVTVQDGTWNFARAYLSLWLADSALIAQGTISVDVDGLIQEWV